MNKILNNNLIFVKKIQLKNWNNHQNHKLFVMNKFNRSKIMKMIIHLVNMLMRNQFHKMIQ